jgi:hypothetical protein
LPAFFATVSAPKNVPFSDGQFPVAVGAQYTFGQKVEGSAVVYFKRFGYELIHQRKIDINATTISFAVDIKNDLKILQNFFDQNVKIEVEFTDKLTAQLAAASTELIIKQFRHSIVFTGPSNFKPGLPFVFKLTVKKFDGSPATENSIIRLSTTFDGKNTLNETFQLDFTGSVDLEIEVLANATSLEILVRLFNSFVLFFIFLFSHWFSWYCQSLI